MTTLIFLSALAFPGPDYLGDPTPKAEAAPAAIPTEPIPPLPPYPPPPPASKAEAASGAALMRSIFPAEVVEHKATHKAPGRGPCGIEGCTCDHRPSPEESYWIGVTGVPGVKALGVIRDGKIDPAGPWLQLKMAPMAPSVMAPPAAAPPQPTMVYRAEPPPSFGYTYPAASSCGPNGCPTQPGMQFRPARIFRGLGR